MITKETLAKVGAIAAVLALPLAYIIGADQNDWWPFNGGKNSAQSETRTSVGVPGPAEDPPVTSSRSQAESNGATSSAQPRSSSRKPPTNLARLDIVWTTAYRQDEGGQVVFAAEPNEPAYIAYTPELENPDGSYVYPDSCFTETRLLTADGKEYRRYPSEPCNGGQVAIGTLPAGQYSLRATARWSSNMVSAKSSFTVRS